MTGLTLEAAVLLLDMDGTLVHSTGEVEAVWRLWCPAPWAGSGARAGHVPRVRSREVIRALAPGWTWRLRWPCSTSWRSATAGRQSRSPGPAPLLGRLPADRWSLVISASHRVARHRLGSAGLPLPRLLVGAEDVVRGKPDPEPICWPRAGSLAPPTAWCSRMHQRVSPAPCGPAAGWCRSGNPEVRSGGHRPDPELGPGDCGRAGGRPTAGAADGLRGWAEKAPTDGGLSGEASGINS